MGGVGLGCRSRAGKGGWCLKVEAGRSDPIRSVHGGSLGLFPRRGRSRTRAFAVFRSNGRSGVSEVLVRSTGSCCVPRALNLCRVCAAPPPTEDGLPGRVRRLPAARLASNVPLVVAWRADVLLLAAGG